MSGNGDRVKPLFYVKCNTLRDFMQYCATSHEILRVEDKYGYLLVQIFSLGSGALHIAYVRLDVGDEVYDYIKHDMTKDKFTLVEKFGVKGNMKYIPIVSAELIGIETVFK